jgi:hypothetical protein
MPRHDRGTIVFATLLVAALTVAVLLGLGGLARRVADHGRAQTAADAAALAGVEGGRAASDEAANRNGGTLLAFDMVGHDVLVLVRVGGAEARARASP